MEGKRKKWKKMLMAVSAVMLAAGLAVIIQKNLDYQKGADDYSEAEQIAEAAEWKTPGIRESKEKETVEKESDPYIQSLAQLNIEALKEINDEVIGWIMIPDSEVSYPLIQGADNSYYLERTWKKEKSAVGSIFLECQVSKDLSDFNTIIYRHKMRNGSMFGSLEQYKEETYWREHPRVYIVSGQEVHRYEIYAVYEAGVRDLTYHLKIEKKEKKEVERIRR